MKMYIAGRWVDSPKMSPVVSSYSGKEIDQVPEATEEQVEQALAAGVQGAKAMAELTAYDRCKILEKAAKIAEEQINQ